MKQLSEIVAKVVTPETVRQWSTEGHPLLSAIGRHESFVGVNLAIQIGSGPHNFLQQRARDYEFVLFEEGDDEETVRALAGIAVKRLAKRLSEGLFAKRLAQSFRLAIQIAALRHGDLDGDLDIEPLQGCDGLSDWLPKREAARGIWKGIERFPDVPEQCGNLFETSGLPIAKAIELASRKYDTQLENWIANPTEYDGAPGPVLDSDCPFGHAFHVLPGAYGLTSAGPCPRLLDWDGITLLGDPDHYQLRFGWYGNTTLIHLERCVHVVNHA